MFTKSYVEKQSKKFKSSPRRRFETEIDLYFFNNTNNQLVQPVLKIKLFYEYQMLRKLLFMKQHIPLNLYCKCVCYTKHL